MRLLLISLNFLILLNKFIFVLASSSFLPGRLSTSTSVRPVAACGSDTTVEFNPWAAILYFNDEFRCGATILGHHLAITASHCVLGKPTHRLLLYYGRTIRPDTILEEEDELYKEYGGKTRILAVKNHPLYSRFDECEGNDIAVLKLETYIPYSDFVRNIKVVPTEPKYQTMFGNGKKVQIAGFGQLSGPPSSTNRFDYPEVMQLVENRIVPHQICNRGNSTNVFGPPRDGICTRGRCRLSDKNEGSLFKQICDGDSGSGVVQYFPEDNQFYLIGVVSCSYANNGEDCGHSKTPSLSINVRDHRTFIYGAFNSEVSSTDIPSVTTENVDKANIYVAGGRKSGKALKSVEVFHPLDNSWSHLPPMSTPRNTPAVAVHNNQLYVMGGYNDQQRWINTAEKWDSVSRLWQPAANMSTARSGAGAAELEGELYLVGGASHGLSALSSVEKMVNNKWEPVTSLPQPRSSPGVVQLGEKIYAIGGWSYGTTLKSVTVWDREAWREGREMSEVRNGPGVAVMGGSIYVAGGLDEAETVLDSVEVFNVDKNEWKKVAPMNVGRAWPALVSAEGKLFVFGGEGEGYSELKSAEQYDPERNEWSFIPDMKVCAGFVGAAVLSE